MRPTLGPFAAHVQREPTPRAHLRAAAANAAQRSGGPRSWGSGSVPTTQRGTGSPVTSKPTLQPSGSGSGLRGSRTWARILSTTSRRVMTATGRMLWWQVGEHGPMGVIPLVVRDVRRAVRGAVSQCMSTAP
jgi:hypothetical protein